MVILTAEKCAHLLRHISSPAKACLLVMPLVPGEAQRHYADALPQCKNQACVHCLLSNNAKSQFYCGAAAFSYLHALMHGTASRKVSKHFCDFWRRLLSSALFCSRRAYYHGAMLLPELRQQAKAKRPIRRQLVLMHTSGSANLTAARHCFALSGCTVGRQRSCTSTHTRSYKHTCAHPQIHESSCVSIVKGRRA